MELGSYIDQTKLGFTVTSSDVKKVCEDAKKYHFASVCIPPSYVAIAHSMLRDTSVAVCTVVGFPFGNQTIESKVFETENAIQNGATEIDMVLHIGALKEQSYDYLIEEVSAIRDACKGNILKVIIETSVLTEDEIREATKICNLCYVNFIKTSTGFGSRGVNTRDLEIITEEKNALLEIKASGGIRTSEDALTYIEAGASRLGTSHGVDIIETV